MSYKWDKGTHNAAIIFLLVVAFLILAWALGEYL